MNSYEYDLLIGWLCWLNHNGHSKEKKLMFDVVMNLFEEYRQLYPFGSHSKWREKVWAFSGFLAEKNFFDGEPTVREMRQWLPAFADSEDWPFNKNDAQTIRVKVVG